MKKTLIAAGLALALSLGAGEYKVDPAHSSVEFKVKHLLVSNVGGSFKNFDGKIDLDPKSKKINFLEGEINIGSINTENQKRDDHLRSPDFFDAQKNPKGHFKMTQQDGDKIYGILTLNGVSKEVEFGIDISDAIIHPKTKKNIVGLELEGEIKRKDFGIGANTPDSIVSDKVKISINLELIAQ
ncbi:YceI family protein [Helicobacter pametensis]|uniref:YceI family protein n=1 Tax=Helicobacter pametensis TaxID=95149 RepID=UPI0004852158|nr:YceI family protein [Helicobacter pametensis]